MPRGLLVAIEGIDGAGTTTQTARLAEWLARDGHAVHRTREPSTGPIGQLLREFLSGRHAPGDRAALALLFAADRLDHLRREIEPARAAGQIVLTDRYLLSSLAYQSIDLSREFVVAINCLAPDPDLTLWVDLPVEAAAQRRRQRGGPEELFDDFEFQARVGEAYRHEVGELRRSGRPVVIIDGRPSANEVFDQLKEALARHLPGMAP